MMGRQTGDQASLFYEFRLDDRIPKDHLLRRINVFIGPILGGVRGQLKSYYSEIGRPSVDPELMVRMLIIGYCFGLRSERRLTQEVELHLAYRWFCRLDLDDKIPHHSTFSENRLHRFRESDVFRQLFEGVVAVCMAAGLVKGEGFAVDASVMEANASRYHGKAPDEIVWAEPEHQTRAVREYLAGLEAENEPNPDRKPPKVISPSDPCSAWTAKANKRVQFGYGLNYLVDTENAVIVDVEPTPARTYDEVEATKTMLERTERRLNLKPKRLAADTAYGTGRFLGWLVGRGIAPHIPVRDASERDDGTFSRSDFRWDSRGGVYICPNNKVLHPLAQCTTALCYAIAPPNSIVMSARLRSSAVPTRLRVMFPVICKKTPAMWHVGLWGQSASSNHGTNASGSRCVLLTSRSTTDLSACDFEDCPARVTSSISPLSYRTSKPWRSVPLGHPLRPSSPQHRENLRDQREPQANWP